MHGGIIFFSAWSHLHDEFFCGSSGLFAGCDDGFVDYTGVKLSVIMTDTSYSPTFGFHAIATYLNSLNLSGLTPNYVYSTLQAEGIINSILTPPHMYTDSMGNVHDANSVKDNLFGPTYND